MFETVKILRPHQLGWLRRPELDHDDTMVWELPDGKLWAQHKSDGEPTISKMTWKPDADQC